MNPLRAPHESIFFHQFSTLLGPSLHLPSPRISPVARHPCSLTPSACLLGIRRGLPSKQPDHIQHRAGVCLP